MQNKKNIYWAVFIVIISFIIANSANAQGAEDQAIGFLDKILDVFAEFFDKIFQSIANAVKSVFSNER